MNRVPGQSTDRRLSISLVEQEEELVLSLSGAVDMFTVTSLQTALDSACTRQAARIRVNCSGLKYLNSSGIGALYNAHRKCTGFGGELILDSVSPKMHELIELLGLKQILLPAPSSTPTHSGEP